MGEENGSQLGPSAWQSQLQQQTDLPHTSCCFLSDSGNKKWREKFLGFKFLGLKISGIQVSGIQVFAVKVDLRDTLNSENDKLFLQKKGIVCCRVRTYAGFAHGISSPTP